MPFVKNFYKNEHILIVGDCGFVGKLLISKLLLSCPQIKKITFLINKADGARDINSKLENLFRDAIFDKLKKQIPKYSEKIDIIEGDYQKIHLGLSQMDRFQITQNITVVFHFAAHMTTTDDLRKEIIADVFSAFEMITMAKYIRNLKAFIYISTSYSNSHLPIVEEKLYKPAVHYKTLIKLTKTNFLTTNQRHILGDIASTHFYSKTAAEQAIREEGKGLPIAIFRPSAIISTSMEPISGWTDETSVLTVLIKSIILGYFSSVLCADDTIVDMVPGDFMVNALIAVAWDVHKRYVNNRLGELRVYNYTSMMDNPIHLKIFLQKIFAMVSIRPSQCAVWYPKLSFRETKHKDKWASKIRPGLLTVIFWSWNRLLRRDPSRTTNFYKLHDHQMNILSAMIKTPHIYLNDNIEELWQDMDEWDQKTFMFDIKTINWDVYLKAYYDGILQYVIKEKNRNEEKAQMHHLKLHTLHSITTALVCFTGGLLIYLLFCLAFNTIFLYNYKK